MNMSQIWRANIFWNSRELISIISVHDRSHRSMQNPMGGRSAWPIMSRPILQDLGWWISHLDDFEYQHLQRFGHPCRATPTSADKHQPHLLRKSWWSTTSAPRAGSRAAVDLNAGENQIDRIWQVIGPWTIIYIYILPESNIWWWNMVLGEIAVTSSQFSPFFTKQPQGHFFYAQLLQGTTPRWSVLAGRFDWTRGYNATDLNMLGPILDPIVGPLVEVSEAHWYRVTLQSQGTFMFLTWCQFQSLLLHAKWSRDMEAECASLGVDCLTRISIPCFFWYSDSIPYT